MATEYFMEAAQTGLRTTGKKLCSIHGWQSGRPAAMVPAPLRAERPRSGRLQVLLCHSVLGLRDVEREAADFLRSNGHVVSVPDLFEGAIASSIDEGGEIVARLGWSRVCGVAQQALEALPARTVLAGFSMGTGVASELWSRRPHSAGAVFFHAIPTFPVHLSPNVPIQVHLGEDDRVFAAPAEVEALITLARRRKLAAEVFRYPGAGHFFTDRTLLEFDRDATSTAWNRVLAFLAQLNTDRS